MIRKILRSKRAEGYTDVMVGVIAIVIFILIALNIFTFVTLKTTMDRIADDLIETAAFSGAFGDDFNAKVDQLREKYFEFEIDVYAERYFNAEHSRVQLGDDMGITIRTNTAVAGIGIALPINLAVSRISQSEQHWQPATGLYEKPEVDNTGKTMFVLNTQAFEFHTPSCSTLASLSSSYRKDMFASAQELIALNYSACNVCNPHDCTTESAAYYNINGHWGNCKFCGEEGPLEAHLFAFSLSDRYYRCQYCNAIMTESGVIYCQGGTLLTSETHDMNCNCSSDNTYLVTVDGAEIGEYKAGETVKVTAPATAAATHFAGWSGLDGVELKPGYTAQYMTIEFTMPAKAVVLTSSEESVPENMTYPTYAAPNGETVQLNVAFSIRQTDHNYTSINNYVSGVKNSADVVVMIQVGLSEAEIAQIAETNGYSHYLYVHPDSRDARRNVLLSKYAFAHLDTTTHTAYDASKYNRTFSVVQLNVNGTPVNICFGQNAGGDGWYTENYRTYVKTIDYYATQLDIPFVLAGYSFSHAELLTGLKADTSLYNNNTGGMLFGTGVSKASGNNGLATLNIEKETPKYLVTVDGTEIGEYKAGETVKVTAPATAAATHFAGWSGLDGVELKPGYTAQYMTIEFTMPTKEVTLTSNEVSVPEIMTYPTYEAPSGEMEQLSVAFSIRQTSHNYTSINNYVSGVKNSADVVVMIQVGLSEEEIAKIAEANGYSQYLYVQADSRSAEQNVLMSKYTFAHLDTTTHKPYGGDGYNRAFSVVQLDVNGTPVNLCFGKNTGGNGWYTENYRTYVKTIDYYATQLDTPFILAGYSFRHESLLTGLKNDTNLYNATKGGILYGTGVSTETYAWNDAVVTTTLNIEKYAEKYMVTMDGTELGEYKAGETVTLTAPTAPTGKVFDKWVVEGDVVTLADATATTTTFTMPEVEVKVTATYKDAPKYAVTVNGAAVGSYAAGETVKVTAPATAAAKRFAGWTGLDGVELKPGYTAQYMAIEFTMPAKEVTLTSNEVSVPENMTYPTYVAPSGETVQLNVAFSLRQTSHNYASINSYVAGVKNSADVVVMIQVGLSEAEIAQIAEANGYGHYLYVQADSRSAERSVLLSKYAFAHLDTTTHKPYGGDGYNRAFSVVQLDVNGTPVNLCFGKNTGGNGWYTEIYRTYVMTIDYYATQLDTPFILVGYSFSHAKLLTGLKSDTSLYNNNTGGILFGTGVSKASGNNGLATLNIEK